MSLALSVTRQHMLRWRERALKAETLIRELRAEIARLMEETQHG